MSYYRKKPVVIEAVQFTHADSDRAYFGEPTTIWLSEALHGEMYHAGSAWLHNGDLIIGTLEGDHRANPGDWIIRGVQGELYPCKQNIFTATYELAHPQHIQEGEE